MDDSAQIIGDVVLGEHASVWMNAVVRGDVYAIRIGAHSNIQDCSVLHGMKNTYGVTLGEYVTVGHSVTLHGCEIEDRCLIGMGSIILNGAKIGAGSIIAAGTLIPERTVVEPGSLWMGSPGKFRRKLETDEDEDDHDVCQELSGIHGRVFAGAVRANFSRSVILSGANRFASRIGLRSRRIPIARAPPGRIEAFFPCSHDAERGESSSRGC